MANSDDLHSIAKEADDVVRIERLTHNIQRIREDHHAMRAAIERMSEAMTPGARNGFWRWTCELVRKNQARPYARL